MRVLPDHREPRHRRLGDELLEGLDRRARDVVSAQRLEPLRARALAEARLEERRERVPVLDAQHPGGKARVVHERAQVECLAELCPERLVAAGEEEPAAVARLVEAVGRVLAEAGVLVRVEDDVARLQREHGLHERRLHLLAAAGALPREERGQDRLARERRRVVVGHRNSHVLGRAAEPLERHHAAQRLEERVEAGPPRVGPGRGAG